MHGARPKFLFLPICFDASPPTTVDSDLSSSSTGSGVNVREGTAGSTGSGSGSIGSGSIGSASSECPFVKEESTSLVSVGFGFSLAASAAKSLPKFPGLQEDESSIMPKSSSGPR